MIGPPHRISQNVEIILMLGDVVEDKILSQFTFNTIGVGTNEDKSLISAIKNLNPQNQELKGFILDGKQKILDFYQANCEEIIAQAQQKASQDNYEEALFMLSTIPDVCSDCFERSATVTADIYEKMINVRGAEYLQLAKTSWAQNPDRQGAQIACSYLSRISSSASCQNEVELLLQQISSKMNDINKQEWEFEMQQYRDSVEHERRVWNQQVKKHNDHVTTLRGFRVRY